MLLCTPAHFPVMQVLLQTDHTKQILEMVMVLQLAPLLLEVLLAQVRDEAANSVQAQMHWQWLMAATLQLMKLAFPMGVALGVAVEVVGAELPAGKLRHAPLALLQWLEGCSPAVQRQAKTPQPCIAADLVMAMREVVLLAE